MKERNPNQGDEQVEEWKRQHRALSNVIDLLLGHLARWLAERAKRRGEVVFLLYFQASAREIATDPGKALEAIEEMRDGCRFAATELDNLAAEIASKG